MLRRPPRKIPAPGVNNLPIPGSDVNDLYLWFIKQPLPAPEEKQLHIEENLD